jgi:hypothetical protein
VTGWATFLHLSKAALGKRSHRGGLWRATRGGLSKTLCEPGTAPGTPIARQQSVRHHRSPAARAKETLIAEIGDRTWAIAEGYIPSRSVSQDRALVSHETACILNPADNWHAGLDERGVASRGNRFRITQVIESQMHGAARPKSDPIRTRLRAVHETIRRWPRIVADTQSRDPTH